MSDPDFLGGGRPPGETGPDLDAVRALGVLMLRVFEFQAQGCLVRIDSGWWRVGESCEASALPETIQATVRSLKDSGYGLDGVVQASYTGEADWGKRKFPPRVVQYLGVWRLREPNKGLWCSLGFVGDEWR